jgi:hypothetical protein
MSVVDSILFVVAASHVAVSISAWSWVIPHQCAIQWATVWSQKVDSVRTAKHIYTRATETKARTELS